jgi:DNA invertase Pin-like site-specific DNA recombinase
MRKNKNDSTHKVKLGYARVSTDEQDTDNQVKELVKEGIPLGNIYKDDGISGKVDPKKRPEFKKVYNRILKGEVEELYVFEISRLGRTSVDSIPMFIEIEKLGTKVKLVSPNERWLTDFNEPGMRTFLVSMLAWFAELERKNISERTKLGLKKAKADGKKLGRGFKEPNREKFEKCKRENPGLKTAQIARLMSIPQATLYRWVERWDEQDRAKQNEKACK